MATRKRETAAGKGRARERGGGRMYVGQAVLRREDVPFLRGRGRFVENVWLDRLIAHAAFVRSPHAHAAVRRVDTAEAALAADFAEEALAR